MNRMKSEFLQTMRERGFVHQCTDLEALDASLSAGPVTAYIGYDCTAPSLHIGSLVQMMMQRWLQKCGHRPIVLMGGATTKVGDPTGKDATRQILSYDVIDANIASIKTAFSQLLRFGDGPNDAVLVNNDDWLSEVGYLALLRDVGAHFSINRMLTFDSVKLRLEREQPMSFLEFNYMILQAYDFRELYQRFGCVLQSGGSDQWGNIVAGVELCRRSTGASVHGLTTPLLMTASGAKMGKTEAGAVWLNEDMLPAFDFWQFWRNTEDPDVGRYLRLFTELPLEEVARLEVLRDREINEAKRILATEVTALVRGREAALAAEETARRTFEMGVADAGLPTVDITRDELGDGLPIFQLFRLSKLCRSGGEARKLIRGGGARLNDKAVDQEERSIGADEFGAEGTVKLSAGRKRHVLLRLQ